MRKGHPKKVLPDPVLHRTASKEATQKDFPFNPKFGKFTFKIALGFFVFFFFLNYQPIFAFPPVKKPQAHASNNVTQFEQHQIISAQSLPFVFQLPHPGYLSSSYSSSHPGIDIATGLGMPVKPIAKGVVVSTGYNIWGLGLTVEVAHGSGYRSLYAHLGKIYVTAGKQLSENEYIGEVGLTGHTSGPHTHLEVSLNGNNVNPLKFLPELRNLPQAKDFATRSATLQAHLPK